MLIRPARAEEAEAAAEIVRRSITELCEADYRGDAAVLARWLEDKTAADMRRWIGAPDRCVFVAQAQDGTLTGVGMVSHAGSIELNYVAPEARFQGVSKQLVRTMEAHLAGLGRAEVSLASSCAARQLYRDLGYVERGACESRFGTLACTLMVRRLAHA